MGRIKRADAAGAIYHMLNRGNRRATMFEKEADFEAFERILIDAVAKFEIELFSYCVLSNHWHLVVGPKVDGEMSRFAQWLTLTLTHTQRYHAHHHFDLESALRPRGRPRKLSASSDCADL